MTQKILIVDDEQPIREPLKQMLVRQGYTVCEAEDGKKGLEEARKQKPDLMILDVNMPKMDGFKVLEELKKDKSTMNIPVFMLTTRDTADDVAAGISGFAEKYIAKPFEFSHLLSEIKKTLERF